ncbi:MAG TPA: hypothetical protein DHW22_13480 [Planctomycetaceae bacterium]|nr:hypothetical protein [Planctomycetaceae bacterium]
MNRKIILSLFAVALMAVGVSVAQAATQIQLNLRYADPNTEASGGTWELLAKTDNAAGIAGISVDIANINNDAVGAGVSDGGGFEVFQSGDFGGIINIAAGDDLTSVTNGVGISVGTSADDLFPGSSPIWDNSSLFASGTFGAVRPVIQATTAVNEFDANDGSTAASAVAPTFSVRGDGVLTDGLISGDMDRSGGVDLFGDVLGALGQVGVGTTWDNGDFDSSGGVDLFGDVLGALGNVGQSTASPAAASAVPEPTSIALLSLAAVSMLGLRRHSK